mmetsp:Transcript_26307/g.66970  ORF Transcript_26307/g.66970 Transcript_26307/m.66970 type:complete len:209 (-) Transcript_26307:142-768(-)
MPASPAVGSSPGSVKQVPKKKNLMETTPKAGACSWADLEQRKARAAGALDRVEYLGGVRNKFTDLKAKEARTMELTIRCGSTPVLLQLMQKSASAPSNLLEKQRDALTSSKTVFKRMDRLNQYITNEEKKKGPEQLQAAKESSRGLKPMERPYPQYQDLFAGTKDEQGKKTFPTLAVGCSMPYSPPEESLMHGAKTPNASMRSMRSTR